MKKLWMTALLVSTLQFSDAQVEKGRIGIGGMLYANFNSENSTPTAPNTGISDEENTFIDFRGSPGAMFFLKNGLAVNANISVGYSTQKYENMQNNVITGDNYNYTKNQNNSYGIQVGLTQYKKLLENFYLTFGGGLGYTYELPYSERTYTYMYNTSRNNNDYYSSTKMNNLRIVITPGFSYFVSKKIALNANFGNIGGGYRWGNERLETYTENTNGGVTTTDYIEGYRDISKFDFNFSLVSSIGLGVQYFIK